ncbi:hypothetical protein ROP_40060 [Rhodococcus opacus B4]|uniref:Uncharacterized protein n=1 Tax=Rhodococcus opacus (strain B4) TaxID=632772 RepID=C1B9A0_RHOOB|nr:hypothetical protein [Rhodococcus opacus]BAH52253.1 hypothetical protein ROP_40060 [Rhodococcus opacus B4]
MISEQVFWRDTEEVGYLPEVLDAELDSAEHSARCRLLGDVEGLCQIALREASPG